MSEFANGHANLHVHPFHHYLDGPCPYFIEGSYAPAFIFRQETHSLQPSGCDLWKGFTAKTLILWYFVCWLIINIIVCLSYLLSLLGRTRKWQMACSVFIVLQHNATKCLTYNIRITNICKPGVTNNKCIYIKCFWRYFVQ